MNEDIHGFIQTPFIQGEKMAPKKPNTPSQQSLVLLMEKQEPAVMLLFQIFFGILVHALLA
jgi:hypothetical protein